MDRPIRLLQAVAVRAAAEFVARADLDGVKFHIDVVVDVDFGQQAIAFAEIDMRVLHAHAEAVIDGMLDAEAGSPAYMTVFALDGLGGQNAADFARHISPSHTASALAS